MHQGRISFDEFKTKLGIGDNVTREAYSKESVSETMKNVERIVEAVHNGNI